ncbi:hypothetical protein [Cytobacillus sp. AMY 15.2]|nr:hypothetical protein [Cytobacillus sp. AMY 15.2]
MGVLTSEENDSLQTWEYALYNDELTDESIRDVYLRMFKTLDELKQ